MDPAVEGAGVAVATAEAGGVKCAGAGVSSPDKTPLSLSVDLTFLSSIHGNLEMIERETHSSTGSGLGGDM